MDIKNFMKDFENNNISIEEAKEIFKNMSIEEKKEVVKELTKQVDDLEKRFYYHRDRILKGLKQKEKKVKMRIDLMRHKIKILKSKIKE